MIKSSLLFLVMISSAVSQELYSSYNTSSIESCGAGFCPSTEKLREKIREDVNVFLNSSVVPMLTRSCGCGGLGWRRAAYLDMSDPTQTCPPAWKLITAPRRSCARPTNAAWLADLLFGYVPYSRHSIFSGLWKNHWISGWTTRSIYS